MANYKKGLPYCFNENIRKNATRNPQLSLKITFSLLIRHHSLFIMQSFYRMNFQSTTDG